MLFNLESVPPNVVDDVTKKARKGSVNCRNAGNRTAAPHTPNTPTPSPPRPPKNPPFRVALDQISSGSAKQSDHALVMGLLLLLCKELHDFEWSRRLNLRAWCRMAARTTATEG